MNLTLHKRNRFISIVLLLSLLCSVFLGACNGSIGVNIIPPNGGGNGGGGDSGSNNLLNNQFLFIILIIMILFVAMIAVLR